MHRDLITSRLLTLSFQLALVISLVALASPAMAQEDPPAPAPEPTAAPAGEAAAQPPEDTSSASKIATVYRNGYSVTITGKKAQAVGTFSMAFKASQEDPVTFTVNVTKGMKAKQIAQDLKKELTIAAGSRYKVKQSGTKVTVKKTNKKVPPLAVQITEQKLTGVSLLISGT